MKRAIVLLSMLLLSCAVFSQEQEAKQLLLNFEKLMQFKKILKNMYDGWKVIDKGYTGIKNISSGNFQLHKGFLDALMEVSPAVKKYQRINDIIHYQTAIVKQYKSAWQRFKEDAVFTAEEIGYMGKVYANLFNESVKNMDELLLVITAGELRMSDDQRLQAIDRIYADMVDQFSFLQDFNSSTLYLSLQRKAEKAEIEMGRRVRGE
jgi:hypothetical protein